MRNGKGTFEYRRQDVMGSSPLRLVIMAYDLAISSCENKDFIRATKAVSILRDALNYDFPEPSVGLFKLYQYCLDCMRKEDYKPALDVLNELRGAWSTIEQSMAPIQSAVVPQGVQAQVGVS